MSGLSKQDIKAYKTSKDLNQNSGEEALIVKLNGYENLFNNSTTSFNVMFKQLKQKTGSIMSFKKRLQK